MNLIFFGPPGVGKGTQAELLAKRMGIPHISTGAIFRAALADGEELGRQAKEYMDRGALVPDELTTAIVVEALKKPEVADGFILDGYPRNLSQARALDEALEGQGRTIDRVIYLVGPDDEIVRRMLKRGRSDDNEETIRHRLEVYNDETAPVLEHYRGGGMAVEIDGVGEIDDVHQRVFDATRIGAES